MRYHEVFYKLEKKFTSMKANNLVFAFLILFAYACGGSGKVENINEDKQEESPATQLIPVTVNTLDTVAMSASQCWGAISDFNSMDKWLAPAIVASTMEGEGVGAVRTLTLEDGNKVVEELLMMDEQQMAMRYKIIEGDPNLGNYVGYKKVIPVDDDLAAIDWTSTFESPAGSDSASYALIKGVHLLLFQNLDQAAQNE